MKRLSNWEYERTVRALTASPTSVLLPPESDVVAPFAFPGAMSSLALEALFSEAEQQGAAVAATAASACQGNLEQCGSAFVADFVRRAFRRPLNAAETARYESVFKAGLAGADISAGISLAVAAALISPNFLYKLALGDGAEGAISMLTDYEVATKLSYFLTGGPPDATLGLAAENAELGGSVEIAREATRLLSDVRFTDVVQHVHTQWLGLDRLPRPSLSAALADSMRTEALKFIEYVFDTGGRKVSSLLTAPVAFVDANLAPIYGVPSPLESFRQTALDETERAGTLTLASTLANYPNPTQRGMFVRERLLCQSIPAHPPDVDETITVSPDQTRREAWQQAMTSPVCAACHQMIDAIGFGFENFDELGRYRTTDNGHNVDASGEIVNASGLEGPFYGAAEVAKKLSDSRVVYECTTQQWIVYLNQRPLSEYDACLLDDGVGALDVSLGDIGEMLVAIASSESFRRRAALPKADVPESGAFDGTVTTTAERRKLLLDLSLQELQYLRMKLPPADQQAIDVHVESVRELERRLAAQ